MTPLTFVSNDDLRTILFKLVAAQGGPMTAKSGDMERELMMKFLQNGGSGSGAGVDATIVNATALAAVETPDLTLDSIKLFYDEDFDEVQAWQLRTGSDATAAGSVQRPDDFNAGSPRTWYRVPLV